MATDILVSQTPTKTKQMKVGFTSQKPIAFQGATQCSATCPNCRSSCVLEAGHTVEHKCTNNHQWGTTAPGPH